MHDMEPLYHQYTRRDLLKNTDLDLHAQHFFYIILSVFPFCYSLFDQDISAFEKLLNCIRQEGNTFFFLRAASPHNQTGFSWTSDYRRGVKSLTEFDDDGSRPVD